MSALLAESVPLEEGLIADRLRARGAGAVLVYSSSEALVYGLAEMLDDDDDDDGGAATGSVHSPRELSAALALEDATVIVDADTLGAREAIAVARAAGHPVVLLLAGGQSLEPELMESVEAVLVRDRVDALALRIALAVGSLGLRLLPPEASPGAPQAPAPALPEATRRILQMLAGGLRDAEIAAELQISECAVRKAVHRTLQAIGARTRCHAVAMAIRSSLLS
ncbi:MAG: helix-turn-helix transcriptional regulator [Solirubrobacteraceae bacterium]